MKHIRHGMALGALLLSMGGCSSLHLYHKDADAAATSAKADYDASHIDTAIDGEAAMLDGLEAKEVEAFRKVTEAERNATLLSLVSESRNGGVVPRLRQLAVARLAELVGDGTNPLPVLKALNEARLSLHVAKVNERNARVALEVFNAKFVELPACVPAVAALESDPSAAAAIALTDDPGFQISEALAHGGLVDLIRAEGAACGVLLAAQAAATAALPTGGTLGPAFTEAQDQEATLAKRQGQAAAAGAALDTAASNLAAAQQAAADASRTLDLTCDAASADTTAAADQSPVERHRNELCNALAKLNKLDDFGIKVISQERLARIDAVLAAMSGIEPPAGDPPLPPSLALLGAGVRFSHALQEYRSAGTLPALEPLLIDKQLTAARLARAQAGVDLAVTRVRLAEQFRDATLLEVDLLVRLQAALGNLGSSPAGPLHCMSLESVDCASMSQLLADKAFNKTPAPGEESVSRRTWRAMALLSESYSVARDRQTAAQVKLIDTDYRDSLARSQASIAAWDALISVPVDQLQAYHAAGWTAQEFAQLLQAFGVVGVAARIK